MTEVLASLLINALSRKGFEKSETHHTMLWFVVHGRRSPFSDDCAAFDSQDSAQFSKNAR